MKCARTKVECEIKTDQFFRDANLTEATTTEVALHIRAATRKMEAATTRRSVTSKTSKVMRVSLSVKTTSTNSNKDKKGGRFITVCRTATLEMKLKITKTGI